MTVESVAYELWGYEGGTFVPPSYLKRGDKVTVYITFRVEYTASYVGRIVDKATGTMLGSGFMYQPPPGYSTIRCGVFTVPRDYVEARVEILVLGVVVNHREVAMGSLVAIDGLTIEVWNQTKGVSTGELWEAGHVTHPSPKWDVGDAYQVKGRLINRLQHVYVPKPGLIVHFMATVAEVDYDMDQTVTNADGYYEFIRTVNAVDNWNGKVVTFWVYVVV